MNLESRLRCPLKHKFFYKETIGSSSFLRKLANNRNSETQYVVDNCVLTNSVDVIKEVTDYIINEKGFINNISHLMKCVYGQVKYLNKLAQNNQILTTPEIISEFDNSYRVFTRVFDKLQETLEISTFDDRDIHKHQERIAEEMFKLNEIMPYCQYENSELINHMKLEFKKTPFYVETIPFKRKPKKISENDLGLFILANFLNSSDNTNFKETILLSNDRDLLAQGPVMIGGELFTQPGILSSEMVRGYGTSFQYSFHKYKQPEIGYNQCLDILNI
jgi:AraC-like DNA-binding protein